MDSVQLVIYLGGAVIHTLKSTINVQLSIYPIPDIASAPLILTPPYEKSAARNLYQDAH